ncbi:MAG: N-acetylmuramic acid 6-phosphate etherase, partial [Planctomycetes bacterium]|nr:N-acetylmuramic acid 6-phosphate etherase [Planctomycetota bacterium]
EALRGGGRLVFAGAGTSGRLGVLEAAEMLPTFGTSSKLVQAVMAGGREAFFQSKEAQDDSYEGGVRAVARIRPTKRDILVGISASGMTPFVRGGLTRARKANAKTVFVTCWSGTELQTFADVTIAPEVGAEVIAGSTRLKAGSATKMILNMLTTIPMVRLGRTYGNLMVDLQAWSDKLVDRGERIVMEATGADRARARQAIEDAAGAVKTAIVMVKRSVDREGAEALLVEHDGLLRPIIGDPPPVIPHD